MKKLLMIVLLLCSITIASIAQGTYSSDTYNASLSKISEDTIGKSEYYYYNIIEKEYRLKQNFTNDYKQLNLSLERAQSTCDTGASMLLFGSVVGIIGYIMYSNSLADIINSKSFEEIQKNVRRGNMGSSLMYGGGGLASIGLIVWTSSSYNKASIEIALAQYKQISMSNAPGVGIRVNF